jgi:hypothetical protein
MLLLTNRHGCKIFYLSATHTSSRPACRHCSLSCSKCPLKGHLRVNQEKPMDCYDRYSASDFKPSLRIPAAPLAFMTPAGRAWPRAPGFWNAMFPKALHASYLRQGHICKAVHFTRIICDGIPATFRAGSQQASKSCQHFR